MTTDMRGKNTRKYFSEEEYQQARIMYKEKLKASGFFQDPEAKKKHNIAQAKYLLNKKLKTVQDENQKNELLKKLEECNRALQPRVGRPAIYGGFEHFQTLQV